MYLFMFCDIKLSKISNSRCCFKLSFSITSELVNCKNGISAEMALKLAKAFKTTAQFWLNMQQAYDLWQARQRVNLDNVEVIEM